MSPRSKYGAVRTEVDGILFASRAEANRYRELKLLQQAGKISHLAVQPTYPIFVGGMKICTYVADFHYREISENGIIQTPVIEDVKGVETPVFKLKRKLLKAVHGFDVRVVKAR